MKDKLRKALRAQRRSLDPAEHTRRSARAAAAVAAMARFKAGARVAVYLPFDREIHTAELLAAAHRRGVRLYVPVIADVRHRRLRFLPLSGKTRRGTYGIAIPVESGRWLAPRWFNLIVVPLVGVDGDGRRLGMGGGFYDRALAFRRVRHHWRGPLLVGFAFDCQRVADVFAEPWDARLDAAASESGIVYFKKG